MLIVVIAWRNIWRNKKRSLTIIFSIMVGLLGGLITVAFSNGMVISMIKNGIDTKYSHVQIHQPEFSNEYDVNLTIARGDSLLTALKNYPQIIAIAGRVLSPVIISSATGSYGLTANGIVPIDEQKLTTLHNDIVDGHFLLADERNSIVIGKKIAEHLKVKIGSKVNLTFQNASHDLTAGSFRVKGIYQTVFSTYDLNNVFVNRTDLARLLEIENGIHEIAILTTQDEMAESLTKEIQTQYPTLLVQSWKDIGPELDLMKTMVNNSLFIVLGIILLALLFGITNTMLMSVMDRTKELGVLMAVGMNQAKVFGMIVVETIFLSLSGGLLGCVFSMMLFLFLSNTGIDLSILAAGLSALGSSSIIFPMITLNEYLTLTVMLIFTAIIAAIYPAWKAIKLNPSTAIRNS